MAERKQISKKKRFEVFKRDSFRCQYCGRSAPDVILEVDHIIPVAEGGKNDLLNLITSCRDCNRGKGKTKLSDLSSVEKQRKQLDDLNDIREQTEMLIQWKTELQQLEERQIDAIDALVVSITGYGFTDYARKEIRALIGRFGFSEVYESAKIAFCKYPRFNDAFHKIGGVCYNRKKKREEDDDFEWGK